MSEKLDKIIDENGIKVSGQGIVIKKLEEIAKHIDKSNKYIWHVDEKLEAIMKKMGAEVEKRE